MEDIFDQPDVFVFQSGRKSFAPVGMKRRRATKTTFRRRKKFRQTGFRRPGGIAGGRRRANLRIGGFLGIENKFFDQANLLDVLVSSTDGSGGELDISSTVCFNAVGQGDGETNRDGRKITMHSLHINGFVQTGAIADATALTVPPLVFLAVVLDKQTNGAQINSEDVYRNQAGSTLTAASPFRNLQHTTRFKVLGTKHLNLGVPGIGRTLDTNMEVTGTTRKFSFNIPLNQMQTTFSGTGGITSNITDNSLHLIGWANNTAGIPTITYNCRLRFSG